MKRDPDTKKKAKNEIKNRLTVREAQMAWFMIIHMVPNTAKSKPFKPVFGSSVSGMHSLECILENTFFRMNFAKNSAFGKILKLFIRSDYAEKNCV